MTAQNRHSDKLDPPTDPDVCTESFRVDGLKHSWRFDGDDPYIICTYCGERRDARSGRTIEAPA